MVNSAFWLIIIAVGAVLVAIGNIQYTRVREVETKQELAGQALAILSPEIVRNKEIMQAYRQDIPRNVIPLQRFDTTAWQTVSGSELLRGLVDEKLSQWLRIYHLMNAANSLHVQLMELSVGVASALGSSNATKAVVKTEILRLMNELEPLLNDLDTSTSRRKTSDHPAE